MFTEGSRLRRPLKSCFIAGSLLAVVSGLEAGGAVEPRLLQSALAMASDRPAAHTADGATPKGFPDFATLARTIGPAVVNVSTSRMHQDSEAGDDPMSQFFQRFFGQAAPSGPQKQIAVGSGFVVTGDCGSVPI